MNPPLSLPGPAGVKPNAQRRDYRAWKFIHPDLDPPGQPAGLQLANGALQMVSGTDAVRQAILLLLSTRPGERVMRPEYGCDLFRLAFAPNDDMTAALAMHYVRQAVERWEPRVEIVNVAAGPDPDSPERLNISLEYRLKMTQQADQLFFSIDLAGGNP